MRDNKKIYLHPKPVFTILSILMGIILVLLLPALYKILTKDYPDGLDFNIVFPEQILLDGILGAIAGVAFAVFCLFRFDEVLLAKLSRLFLLIIISLSFLCYITIKTL